MQDSTFKFNINVQLLYVCVQTFGVFSFLFFTFFDSLPTALIPDWE